MVRSLSLECKLELVPLSATPASKVPGCRWCPGAIVLVLGSYCTHTYCRESLVAHLGNLAHSVRQAQSQTWKRANRFAACLCASVPLKRLYPIVCGTFGCKRSNPNTNYVELSVSGRQLPLWGPVPLGKIGLPERKSYIEIQSISPC